MHCFSTNGRLLVSSPTSSSVAMSLSPQTQGWVLDVSNCPSKLTISVVHTRICRLDLHIPSSVSQKCSDLIRRVSATSRSNHGPDELVAAEAAPFGTYAAKSSSKSPLDRQVRERFSMINWDVKARMRKISSTAQPSSCHVAQCERPQPWLEQEARGQYPLNNMNVCAMWHDVSAEW